MWWCQKWGTMAAVGQQQLPRLAEHGLASFYLAKTLITTHNNQSIRPNRRCTDNNIITGTGDHDKNQYA
jgi:hypothetical protein